MDVDLNYVVMNYYYYYYRHFYTLINYMNINSNATQSFASCLQLFISIPLVLLDVTLSRLALQRTFFLISSKVIFCAVFLC